MFFQLLGNEMSLGDLHLFLVGVAAQLNDLHAIQQRARDRIRRVGRCNEHHAAEIHRDLQKMIPKAAVLLAVQHLQQCRSRIAPHVAGQLVYLVQHQQRIHGAAVDESVHNAAGHGANVCLAMPPNVRLVPHAAQADAVEFSVHGLGHRDGNGGLAHARRPD